MCVYEWGSGGGDTGVVWGGGEVGAHVIIRNGSRLDLCTDEF